MPRRSAGLDPTAEFAKDRSGVKIIKNLRLAGLSSMGIAGALLAIALSPAQAAPSSRSHAAIILTPVTPACVSSPFVPRIVPNRPLAGTFQQGIDLPAPIGSPVTAVAPGTLIRIQRHGIGGLEMLIQH